MRGSATDQRAQRADAVESLRRTVADQAEHIDALRRRTEFLAARERELQAALRRAQAELQSRDGETQAAVEEATRERDERILALEDELRSLNRTIHMMQATRVWQLGTRYWRARDTLRRLLRRA